VSANLTIERYDASASDAWDEIVRGARARHFMFERAYMDYHADRFRDASWFVLVNGHPVAVLPASRHDDEVVSHGGLTFGGLLSGPELTTTRAVAAFEALVHALQGDGIHRLVYKAMPHLYHLGPAEEDLYALHAAGGRVVSRTVTSSIGPRPRPEYSPARRRAVRRAGSHDLELRESDAIEPFWTLLQSVLSERHGIEPVHSAEELRLLATRFPGRIRLFVACERGDIVAGTLIFQTPSVAHAQYIAGSARGRELNALDALFDHLLEHEFADTWFDFGISNERDDTLNSGLIRNKEGYGARAIVHDRYALDLR
jgi:hypothetical protein